MSRRRRESKEERSKPQFEYSSAAARPSIRPSVIPSSRASDAPNCHFGRCAVYFSPSFPRPTVSRGRDFCRYRAYIGDVHYVRGGRGHNDWMLRPCMQCFERMAASPNSKISWTLHVYVPRCQNVALPPAPLLASFVFAPSHRKEQRHNSHVPATGGREGGGEGRTSAQPRTHAQVGRSLGMRRIPATCGKKITFPVSLLAQEETDGGGSAPSRQQHRASSPSSQPSSISPNVTVDQIGRGHVSAQLKSETSFKEVPGQRRDILQSHITLSPRYFLTR